MVGAGEVMLGVALQRTTSYPGWIAIFGVASCYGNRLRKLRPCGRDYLHNDFTNSKVNS